MLLRYFLKKFIKVGTLNLIDAKGNCYRFEATAEPEITLRLHTKCVEYRLCYTPSLAMGEGYMNGDVTIEDGTIYDFLYFATLNYQKGKLSILEWIKESFSLSRRFLHQQNPIQKSRQNVVHHYDLSEDLYRLFLDSDLQYSCGYFAKPTDDLETAQQNKKKHILAKLQLAPGQRVLDIGCGWGGLALQMAREYDVKVTGLTLSEEQHRVATERAKQEGLEDQVSFHLKDYRLETDTYDRVVSVGMFEHVGMKHYPEFFTKVRTLLKDRGIALLHSIGNALGPAVTDPWISKYIFPGGYCPALSETLGAIEPAKLYVSDIEILNPQHYAETLRHWRARFLAERKKITNTWGPQFLRMWEFYLAACEATFRKGGLMVFQIQMVQDPAVTPVTRDYMWEAERVGQRVTKMATLKPKKESRRGL